MRKLQNTLYLTTQGLYLHKQRETLIIEKAKEKIAQIPVHAIGHIHCFGNILISPYLLEFFSDNSIHLSYYTEKGRYLGNMVGKQSGNILLRRAQYRLTETQPTNIARNIIAAKIQSAKHVLQRQQRNHGETAELQTAIHALNRSITQLKTATTLDSIRGIEGEAAAQYFRAFPALINPNSEFAFSGRNRRPPRDPVNAMLSLLYSILGRDISGALQSHGLDPQAGFLHQDRSGRDSLAQDLLEELRHWWADRLILSLINRKQIKPKQFIYEASGAVTMNEEARKILFQALQTKKQETITHPYLNETIEIGLIPHIQAQLLARHIRGELAEYPPFLMK